MQNHGKLFIFSGPSGVGKNTIMHGVLDDTTQLRLRQLPTATTRARRETEREGREHEFLSEDEFRQRIIDKALIEWQIIHDKGVYGVPRQTVQNLIREGRYALADVDVLGAMALKQEFGANVVLIFVEPPSLDILKQRLSERSDVKHEKELQTRLRRVDFEMEFKSEYDYVIVNHENELEASVSEAQAIILKEAEQNATTDRVGWDSHLLDFAASVLIAQDDNILYFNDTIPMTTVAADMMPFEALNAFLTNSFDATFSPTREHAHKRAVDIGFEAPQLVKNILQGERITKNHIYILQADEPLQALPEGWTWQSIENAELDPTLRQLLLDTLGERESF